MENDLYFGLYLCVNGECEMKVNDRLCKINAGDAFVKSPLVLINKMKEYDNFEVVAIFEEEMDVLAPIAEKNIEVVQEFVRQNKFYSTCNEQEQLILLRNKQHIDEYKQELSKSDISAKQYQVIKSIIILMEQASILEYSKIFLRQNDFYQEEIEKGRDVMIKFALLLFQHFKHHRQVKFYADALNLSPNHFTRIIKNVSNRTPLEWIAIVTINQAKKLLCMRNLSIKEVAQELSFPEQYTFRKYFKLYTGFSPKEFKLLHS